MKWKRIRTKANGKIVQVWDYMGREADEKENETIAQFRDSVESLPITFN